MKPILGNPKEGLWGATLGFFVGFAAVSLFGPSAQYFKTLLDLSPLHLGLLVAMPALSGSLLRIPFAAWVDVTGGRKPFLVLLALSVVGMTGLFGIITFYDASTNIHLYPLLLFLGLLSGCGIATFSVGISQVSYWYPQDKQGHALGIFAGVGNLAPGIFSFLLPWSLLHWDLGGSYFAWLVFLSVGTVLYFLKGRNALYFQFLHSGMSPLQAKVNAQEHGQEIFPKGSLLESLVVSAKIWKTWLLVGIYFTTFGGFIALTAWFPTYWMESFGLGAVHAGLLTAMYSLLCSLIRIWGGKIADGRGGEWTLLASLILAIAGSVTLVVSNYLPGAVFGVILLASGMGIANAATFKLVPQEIPQAVGGAAGWVGGLGAFGGFVIPLVMALFIQGFGENGFSLGFLVFVLLFSLAAGCSLVLRKARLHEEALLAASKKEAFPLEEEALLN